MRIYFILLALCCVIFSCSNDEMAVKQPDDVETAGISDVKVVNGVLKFSSKEHLLNVTKQVEKSGDMENWFQGVGFRSLLKRQNELKESDLDIIANTGELGDNEGVLFFHQDETGDLELRKIIEDPRFAAVLNENSFVIVGNEIYHIGQKGVSYIQFAQDENILNRFLTNPQMEGAIFEKTEAQYFRNARTEGISDNIFDDPNNDNRRIRAEFVRHYSVVYISLVVKVRYQKKNWIGWSGTNCHYMSFEALGAYTKQGSVLYFSGSRSGSNVEEISMFVDEVYNLTMNWIGTYGTGSFKGGSGDPLTYFNF